MQCVRPRLILASASLARKHLLNTIGLNPEIFVSNINEDLNKKELPRVYVERLSREKSESVLAQVDSGYIIAADTAVVLGRSVLPKATSNDLVKFCLEKVSGRRHRVYTGVCVTFKRQDGIITRSVRVVMSIVKFKRLTNAEVEWYVNSSEGLGKAGGYAFQGLAQCFIPFISGSVSNIVGLPLFEVKNMLSSLGYTDYKSNLL